MACVMVTSTHFVVFAFPFLQLLLSLLQSRHPVAVSVSSIVVGKTCSIPCPVVCIHQLAMDLYGSTATLAAQRIALRGLWKMRFPHCIRCCSLLVYGNETAILLFNCWIHVCCPCKGKGLPFVIIWSQGYCEWTILLQLFRVSFYQTAVLSWSTLSCLVLMSVCLYISHYELSATIIS